MKNHNINGRRLRRSNTISEPTFYEIKVQGLLSQEWSKWFEGMTLTAVEDRATGVEFTIISGLVEDQPALHGLLNKIRDLNLPLISVRKSIPGSDTVEEISDIKR